MIEKSSTTKKKTEGGKGGYNRKNSHYKSRDRKSYPGGKTRDGAQNRKGRKDETSLLRRSVLRKEHPRALEPVPHLLRGKKVFAERHDAAKKARPPIPGGREVFRKESIERDMEKKKSISTPITRKRREKTSEGVMLGVAFREEKISQMGNGDHLTGNCHSLQPLKGKVGHSLGEPTEERSPSSFLKRGGEKPVHR